METFVKGVLSENMLSGSQQLMEQTEPLGYRFREEGDGLSFIKTGRIESVINELMPICDSLGLDVDDLSLQEFRKGDHGLRSSFEQGEIDRQ